MGYARLSCCLPVALEVSDHWAGKAGKTAEDLAETIQVARDAEPRVVLLAGAIGVLVVCP